MSILLNLCEWLSLHETESYLKLKLNGTPYQLTLDDLMPVIKAKKLLIYWESKELNFWISIGKNDVVLLNNPQQLLTESQIKDEYMGEPLKGYFLLDFENMGLNITEVFDAWGGNYELISDGFYRVVAKAIDDNDSNMAVVWDNAPLSLVDDSAMPLSLNFKAFDIYELMKDFKFKREDIDRIIAIALGKNEPEISGESKERLLTSKTENSYLRLIQALAEYATDGLTGKPSTDANAIEAALKSKDIQCPVGNKALAGYLEKAQQISK
jgi:hypothetical protein